MANMTQMTFGKLVRETIYCWVLCWQDFQLMRWSVRALWQGFIFLPRFYLHTWYWNWPAFPRMGCFHSCVNYTLALSMGTCYPHLEGLHHEPLQLLTFNTLWKEFRVESKNEALCALGKNCQDRSSGSQVFSGADFMYPIRISPQI